LYELGLLLHVPGEAVRVLPCTSVPLMTGSAVLTGAAWGWEPPPPEEPFVEEGVPATKAESGQ
jgi:hypothetical protein